MKFLLAAINAKYIHSNLGIYSLKKYAEKALLKDYPDMQIEMGEYTINNQTEAILQDIYRRNPDVAGFSCYIWNIVYVREIIRDLKKVKPDIKIWLGGPEVSYDPEQVLKELPQVDCIMCGEGEKCFKELVECLEQTAKQGDIQELPNTYYKALTGIFGLAYRAQDGTFRSNAVSPLMDFSEIPFSYEDLSGLEHRIIYYESSRGCPFSCSYCLSSIDKTVRFRDVDLVKKELWYFLEQKVPQVKFVDRTFNSRKSHSMAIWQYILEHDNGITNFHFEISADLLDEAELELMARMRPGLIQLEIGVQTTNPLTIKEIRRTMDMERLKWAVARVNSFGNIHQHLDLIAGLPYEDYESFKHSFHEVYSMEPEQLQLGFLKVLKGSYMEEQAKNYGLLYQTGPPYEVLSTKWLSYGDIIRLKSVENMVEVYYNSGQFRTVLCRLEKEFTSPFDMFEAMAAYYEKQGLAGISHNRLARYEILFCFISLLLERQGQRAEIEDYRDLLMYDLYLRENLKSRPSFARDQSLFKEENKSFFISEAKIPKYLTGYEAYDSRQISKMAHIEVMRDGTRILFDYLYRDALFGNAKATVIAPQTGEDRYG